MNRFLQRFTSREGAKVLANAGWLYLDQIVRLAVGLVVFSLVVRGLGAEQYGVLSYAMAFPGIFLPLAMLGLDYVIVRDFVRHAAEREKIFGTAFALKTAAAGLAFALAAGVAWFAPLAAPDKTLLLVTSLSLLFQPLVTIDYYFQSQVAAKYSSLARMVTSLSANGARAWLALSGASVGWFVWLFAIESAVYAASLLAARRAAKIPWVHPWLSFDRLVMHRLLRLAWPLFLADIAMIGFLKVDQILLSSFAGLQELGRYAAAFRLADNAEFFALALINSYFPRIIQLQQGAPDDLLNNVRRFFARMTWFAVGVALVTTLAAPLIAKWIFGPGFGSIWPVLVVLVWANVFVTQIAARGKWFLAEGWQIYTLVFFAIGAAVHLTLLPYVAPRWGALGAAGSFCTAQIVMAVIAPALFARTRPATIIALRSLLPLRLNGWRPFRHEPWSGDYPSWSLARAASRGYEAGSILEKVAAATRVVRAGGAAGERDSVLLAEAPIDERLQSALQLAADAAGGHLSVLDFGGSLGSNYWSRRAWLATLPSVRWSIVEQSHFVAAGRREFENDQLRFYSSLEDCCRAERPAFLLLSSVLPYVEEPHGLLADVARRGFSFIYIDRTGVVDRPTDRLTVQVVPPQIYSASYPCWFFNRERLLAHFAADYELRSEHDNSDGDGTGFAFKGFFLVRRPK